MNNSVFKKTMENVRKHTDIKLVTTTKKRRDYLVSESNDQSYRKLVGNRNEEDPKIYEQTCLFWSINIRFK